MNKKKVFLVIIILGGLSATSFGRAREYSSSEPVGTVSGWPEGLRKLANSSERIAGIFVNFSFEFFYQGTTEQLNTFLQQQSKLEHSGLWVTLHSDSDRQSLLWNDKLCEEKYQGFDWKLTILPKGRFEELFDTLPTEQDHIVSVDIWLDEGIDKASLVIPANVPAKPSIVQQYNNILAEQKQSLVMGRNTHLPDESSYLVDGNTKFAFDLYAQLKTTKGNLFFSPYSISTALAMTYAGAKTQTANQMYETLCIPPFYRANIRPNLEHAAFGWLNDQLNDPNRSDTYQLSVANALWCQNEFPFSGSFLDINRQYYKAELQNVDFTGVIEREQTRRKINTWVEEQTNEKIKNLIPQGVLTGLTRLVLTNAIYFKGNWADQFDPADTKEEPFYISPDKTVQTPLMSLTENFNYAENDLLQILELPYQDNELNMLILLPKARDKGGNLMGANPASVEVIRGRSRDAIKPQVGSLNLQELEEKLTGENLKNWQKQMRQQKVQVFLPKFKMASQFSLNEILSNMGMPDAFGEKADFSGMVARDPKGGLEGGMAGNKDRGELYISDVIHKAFVEVNEEGTEAAAATGVIVATRSMPAPPPVFRADHPFVFVIKDNQTDSILFVGRVSNPTKEK